MKKLTLLFVAVLFTVGAYAQQDQGTFRGQVGAAYGGDSELGIGVGLQYFFADNIAFAPGYTKYLNDVGFGLKYSSIDLNARYYLSEGFYGLAGIDLVKLSGGLGSASTSEIAIGAGYDLSMSDSMLLNLQAKYAGQMVLGVGVVFSF